MTVAKDRLYNKTTIEFLFDLYHFKKIPVKIPMRMISIARLIIVTRIDEIVEYRSISVICRIANIKITVMMYWDTVTALCIHLIVVTLLSTVLLFFLTNCKMKNWLYMLMIAIISKRTIPQNERACGARMSAT
jgi:hypothetical protein